MKKSIKQTRAIIKAIGILRSVFDDVKADIGYDGDDFIKNKITIQIKIYNNELELSNKKSHKE